VAEVELEAGTIEYEDTGGGGPVLVFLHGVLMDETVWRHVVADLRDEHRCIVPTLPFGSHRRPMGAGADLSLRGHGRLLADFLERLELSDVTLVQIDHGLAQVIAADHPELIERIVFGPEEAFDNYPPGLPGKALGIAGRIPGGINLVMQPMRLRVLRRLPLTLGWMSKRPVPHEVIDRWLRPVLTQRYARRDLEKYVRSVNKDELLEIAEALRRFDKPALVVWAAEDRVMPPAHGRRLAELLPQGRFAQIADCYTLIPEDQPGEFAHLIRQFVRETKTARDAA
jgi:pimeloyl-ACP methyl ester carboxylesterase